MKDRLTRLYRETGAHHWLGWSFVLAFTAAFTVTIPLPLSRSGTLDITAADFVMVLLWAVLGWTLVTRRWRPRPASKALLAVLAALCGWFVVITVVRLLRGDEVLQPFLVLRTTVLPLACYLLLDTRLEPRRRALQGLVVFELLLTLWHLGEWNNMRMSGFLGNSIVYSGLLVLLLPVNLYVASLKAPRAPRLLRWAALFNMLAALIFPVWTGSRGTTGVAFVVIVVCFVVMASARQLVPTMLALASGALVAHSLMWFVNFHGGAYGIYRLVPPPAELGTPMVYEGQATSDLAQRATAVSEKAKSDASRADLVSASMAHVRKDPLIGDGVVYFDIPGDGLVKEYAAHNFVLEHVNAYGAIGYVLYQATFVVALWPGLRRLRHRGDLRRAGVFAGLITAGLLAVSLTQPTTLIMVIMVPYFLAIGALLAPEPEGRETIA